MRVLVVALVAIEVIVVGLLILLLILVVLLFTEPSVDAIGVSLSLSLFSDLFPLVLFYMFSLGQAIF